MGYITELKSKGTRTVINIRKEKEGINYFATETFNSKTVAKKWLQDQESRLEKNPELLSIEVGQVSDSMTFGAAPLINIWKRVRNDETLFCTLN